MYTIESPFPAMASASNESLTLPIHDASASAPPTYMFVYGTLKNGEANFNRWMQPFMQTATEVKPLKEEDNEDVAASACACCLKFVGPALTVHRYPFVIYDYPGVYNAPFDELVAAPTDAEGLRQLNAVEDVDPSRVFYDTPQRVLGEVFEIVSCAKHRIAGADMNTSRIVERLDILEDTATGLYSRHPVEAEVALAGEGVNERVLLSAQIYFRTNAYPRDELIDIMLAAANSSDAGKNVTREAVDSITPRLLSEETSDECVAEGRVAAPKLRGFLRTYRGPDHHKIAACE